MIFSKDTQKGCHFLFKYFPFFASFLLLLAVTIYRFFFDGKHSLDTWCDLQFWVKNTQKLRAFGLITTFSTLTLQEWGRVEGLLTATWGRSTIPYCHSVLADQLFSFPQWNGTWKDLEPLSQTSSLLSIVFHQVKSGLAHVCELNSGAPQGWDSDPTQICCHTHLADLWFQDPEDQVHAKLVCGW